jgi:SSS family solute:Na+ symporter
VNLGTLEILVVLVYLLVILLTTVWLRRARSLQDYAVASRDVPGMIIFASLSANFIGPGYTLGLADKAFADGFVWFAIFTGFSLQTFLVGRFVAPRLREAGSGLTVGDFIGSKYGVVAKLLTGLISVLFCSGIVGVVAKAAGMTIGVFLNQPIWIGAAITTLFVVAYSTWGGIRADIFSDTIQFSIFACVVPVLVFAILWSPEGMSSAAKLSSRLWTDITSSDKRFLLGTFAGFLLGETLVPPYFNRALAARSPSSAKEAFTLSALFSLLWFFVLVALGVMGRELLPFAPSEGVFWHLARLYLPPIGIALMIAAIASIVMSTQDSFLNSASVALVNDLIRPLSGSRFRAESHSLMLSKSLNVLIGLLGVLFALLLPSLVDALLYCYTLWAPTVVLPLVIGVLRKDVSPPAGLSAMLAGGLATGLWEWVWQNPLGIPSLVVGVFINQVVFWSVDLLAKGHHEYPGYLRPIHPPKPDSD